MRSAHEISLGSRVTLLGVPIDAVTMTSALDRLREFLDDGAQHHVATPNNEMLVEAQRNSKFHSVLSSTDLNLPDSSGLLWAARFTEQELPEQVPGIDAMTSLCDSLDETQSVFLLGGFGNVAERASEELQQRNPSLRIAGTFAGSPKEEDAEEILERINDAKPSVLFVAYGAPSQDLWIHQHLTHMPSVKLAMGVGGSFDFLSGKITRAPRFLRNLHLEWLWRLILQPWRFKRIWRAVVIFPFLIVFSLARHNDQKQRSREKEQEDQIN